MDFAQLYARYSRDVFRFAYFLTGNRALAEDIASETFARALSANDDIRPGTVKAYLLAVSRNLFLDSRRVAVHPASLGDEHLQVADAGASPETISAGRMDLQMVTQALQRLPEGERAALLLVAWEGLSHKEAAAALGCSVAAIKVRVHRARLHLHQLTTIRRTP